MSFERFPKLESPFTRSTNKNGAYTVNDQVADGYEWVFEDEDVLAVEKLDGENIAVKLDENKDVVSIYTREGELIEPFSEIGKSYIVKGVLDAFERGWITEYLEADSLHYGELVGPRVKENVYELDTHMWVPFEYAKDNLTYESWGKYPKTYDSISGWFESLLPLFYSRFHNIPFDELSDDAYVEGIVFTHPDGRKAKLRVDMFDWFEGDRHGY